MADLLLGVIAAGVVVIAVAQVAFLMAAYRAGSHVQALVRRLDDDFKPLLAQVRAIADEVARTSALASVQAQRIDEMTTRVASLVDEATATVSQGVLAPLRDGLAFVRGLVAVVTGAGRARTSRRDRESIPGSPD
jgi:hypothetical protein